MTHDPFTPRPDEKDMRDAYCDALIAAAEADSRVIVIDCDLSNSLGTGRFHARFPERSFNLGIMEANACSMAAGLSLTGFVPFVHSFAVFTSRRMTDQIFLSCAYAGLNVKLIGGDAGVSAAVNGGTHMAFEDFGVLRSIVGLRLFEPTDNTMVRALIPHIASRYGVDYIRMPRRSVIKIYEPGETFMPGEAKQLREGEDVTLIASGVMVSEALIAADLLENEGVHASVLDCFTIQPLDTAQIVERAQQTGCVVTAENHNIIGGLGSAVAELLSERAPVPLERVGVKNVFGEVGPQAYLMDRFGLRAKDICAAAHRVIERKQR
ncbi:MAG: transketolase C-terminal domain-containing protein [Eubacteriales bacterium]|jgi:transketolase|nr:transketolase C-terminal domain-containing protein [Eubacteriales bacterium]